MSQILVTRLLITYDKSLIKKLFGGTSRKSDKKEKKKKNNKQTRMAIAKLFALNANAKRIFAKLL